MATNRATSANITRVLRARGYDVIPARDISRRHDDGLRVSNWVKPGVVEVCVRNFGSTLNMGDMVVNVKRDLVFEGYDVRIGYGDAGEDQTVLYVRNESAGA
jgi:hypothetical protein